MKDTKRLERIRRSPTSVQPEELRKVLLSFGFEVRSIRGSHWVFVHPGFEFPLIVPYRRPLKPVYVRMALEAVDEVMR
ncbi:MAG TPA: type II toxin-antitoxin system HicA family toxin [Tepidiformaceae bacterium]